VGEDEHHRGADEHPQHEARVDRRARRVVAVELARRQRGHHDRQHDGQQHGGQRRAVADQRVLVVGVGHGGKLGFSEG
jgi:hypothetical protein